MNRFFFDYSSKDRLLFDYRGQEFGTHGAAIDFAQAMAHDLKHRLTENWAGWSIEVRNVYGKRLCALPIKAEALKAA